MNGIEAKMVKVWECAKPFKRTNTEVKVTEAAVRVYLHGNLIAARDREKTEAHVTLAGWNTRTTRSRLTALGFEARTCKGVPYIRGIKTTDTRWLTFLY